MTLLQLLASRLEPLTEKQLDSIDVLRRSSLQAEEALSREMEALRQSVTETVAAAGSSSLSCPAGSDDDCTGQMAVAVGNLGALEGLLRKVNSSWPWPSSLNCFPVVCCFAGR